MIAIVLGTRPEIIKMSPIIRECETIGADYFILHTGQHYSYEMDQTFFKELELPKSKYNLDVGSGTHADQTGRIMAGIERILMSEQPDVVLVQGDTNTVLAGALAASKLHIKVGHVEAGLRSFDRTMPEEINRIIADHISDHLLAPTETSQQNLLHEGIDAAKVNVTGNTVVDAVHQNLEISERKLDVLDTMGLKSGKYLLVTAHRAENVDVKARLNGILSGLTMIRHEYSLPVIFPMHPRTAKKVQEFGISLEGIVVTQPLGYLDFLQLESNAKLILTDSGGLQEESCILGVPCATLRDNTERPETVEVGANVLTGTDPKRIFQSVQSIWDRKCMWNNPFGNGKSAERIVKIINS